MKLELEKGIDMQSIQNCWFAGKGKVGKGSGLKINKTAEDLKSFAFGKYFTSTLVTCAFSQTDKRLKSMKRCDDVMTMMLKIVFSKLPWLRCV